MDKEKEEKLDAACRRVAAISGRSFGEVKGSIMSFIEDCEAEQARATLAKAGDRLVLLPVLPTGSRAFEFGAFRVEKTPQGTWRRNRKS